MQQSEASKQFKTLFVTVGSTRFDSLINRIVDNDIIELLVQKKFNKIILQIGNGDHNNLLDKKNSLYFDKRFELIVYRYRSSLKNDLEQSDLVISHAGAGSILESLEEGKKLIVVINENLMNNHQFELASKMQSLGYCEYATCANLSEILNKILDLKCKLVSYNKGKPEIFGKFLNNLMSINV
jgi:beta-1,4-N-acetylglucosaminyltransferase